MMKRIESFVWVVALALLGLSSVPSHALVISSFSNSSAVTINDNSTATPYPLSIVVSTLPAVITDLNVTLNGLSHGFASDVGVLLVGPDGERIVLMDGAGGFSTISNANLTFDDQAAQSLSFGGPITS